MKPVAGSTSNVKCDECGSTFFRADSTMTSLCPECAYWIYGKRKCEHEFRGDLCTKCGWDGSSSPYVDTLRSGRNLDAIQIMRCPVMSGFFGGTVRAVHVVPGDTIEIGTILLTVEDESAIVDIPSTTHGTVVRLHVRVGDRVNWDSDILDCATDQTGQHS